MRKIWVIALVPFLVLLACKNGSSSRRANEAIEQGKSEGPVFVRQVFIGAPSDQVWNAIVDPEIVNQYYLVPLAKMDLHKDGDIYYGTEAEHMIEGKVLELMEGQKLVYSFRFSHRPQDPPSRVSYEIKDMGEMTAMTLRHDQFPSENETFVDISSGWDVILSSMKTLLETGRTLPWPKVE